MKRVSKTEFHPHQCILCNSANPGDWVDTECIYTDPGARHLKAVKYVCEGCALEIAELFEEETQGDLKFIIDELQNQVSDLEGTLDGVRDAIRW